MDAGLLGVLHGWGCDRDPLQSKVGTPGTQAANGLHQPGSALLPAPLRAAQTASFCHQSSVFSDGLVSTCVVFRVDEDTMFCFPGQRWEFSALAPG